MPNINCQMIRHWSGLDKGKWHLDIYCLRQQPLKQKARFLIRAQEETIKAAISKFFIWKEKKKPYQIKYSDIRCSPRLVLIVKGSTREPVRIPQRRHSEKRSAGTSLVFQQSVTSDILWFMNHRMSLMQLILKSKTLHGRVITILQFFVKRWGETMKIFCNKQRFFWLPWGKEFNQGLTFQKKKIVLICWCLLGQVAVRSMLPMRWFKEAKKEEQEEEKDNKKKKKK